MAGKKPIDLVVADKNPIVQSGLRGIFDDDPRFRMVAVAADGERFLEAVDRLAFDVGIIGWEMPYLGGESVLKALGERKRAPRIVVYTGASEAGLPRRVMALGGAGFCHKGEPPERLVETVAAVAAGRMVFPFVDLRNTDIDPFAALTGRENQLLAALAEGSTNAQLAAEFSITVNTVKFHLRNLYDKLGVNNRAQAVASYLRAHK